MRPSRRRDRAVRHLHWRVRIFGLGAVLALAGIYLDLGWLVNVALGVLVLGFALRFLPQADEGEGEEADADGEGSPEAG